MTPAPGLPADRGYFADDPVTVRRRLVSLASSRTRTPLALVPLSRRNHRVWRVHWTAHRAEIVKLVCGSTMTEVRAAAKWLAHEVQVLDHLQKAGGSAYGVTDFGQELATPIVTWATVGVAEGCRASVLLRKVCQDESEALDLCLRILYRLAELHRVPLDGFTDLDPTDRTTLDRPLHRQHLPESGTARRTVAQLALARATAPRLALCHGDASLHNILVSPRQVALIDWAYARADLPSLDLAPLFVWLAQHTPDAAACLRLAAELPTAYRDSGTDPQTALPAQLARILLQWSAWRGPRYARTAARVARARTATESITELCTGLRRPT
ncbi:phosphotransferase [Streptacidiphilus sp. P02-A3a]|uniref:phosphotransferase n=1 Tax=Streptacidiphilus sp. P02-A3a TaxID=2704468 RepID=UPI0015FA3C90|nr:phosphotransferase [Streptacidiphilus sp. P02-A3a]QMU69791.1 phosphotransferase [Streptacidiphilus sp. P02-A3a]